VYFGCLHRVQWKAALASESIPTNASKFLPECINDSSATADKGLCFFLGSGLVVDRVLGRVLSGNGPGLGVYCVAGCYSSAFGPGLGGIADKAERETMAGLTDPSAVASGDLFSAASAIFHFKSSTI
jgi:hypothetical protein